MLIQNMLFIGNYNFELSATRLQRKYEKKLNTHIPL